MIQRDQFGRVLGTYIQLLDLNSEEEKEYREIRERLERGEESITELEVEVKHTEDSHPLESKSEERDLTGEVSPLPSNVRVNNKVSPFWTIS